MKRILLLACVAATTPGPAQMPGTPASPAAAPQPSNPNGLTFAEAPTKKKPFILEGKMTVTLATQAFTKSAGGSKSMGSMGNEGLVDPTPGSGKADVRAFSSPTGPADANGSSQMQSNRTYAIQVPPKGRLMVQLRCKRLRDFRLKFVNDTYGRTEDPGLFINRLHHRDDAAFYENKTDQVKTIHCVLVGIEPMTDEPYALVFTDY